MTKNLSGRAMLLAMAMAVTVALAFAGLFAGEAAFAQGRADSGTLTSNPVSSLYGQAKKGKVKTYKIVYKANKGKGTMAALKVKSGKTIKLAVNKFKRTGYTFAGWNTKANGKGKAYKDRQKVKNLAKPGKSVALYAQWKLRTFAVKYNAKGASTTPKSQIKKYGIPLRIAKAVLHPKTNPATYRVTFNYNGSGKAPTKASSKVTRTWKFDSWKAADGRTFDAKAVYAENKSVTFTAQWVTSDSNPAVTLPTPKRSGYTFKGWFTEATGGSKAGNGGNAYTPKKSITLYAQWSKNATVAGFSPGVWREGDTYKADTGSYGASDQRYDNGSALSTASISCNGDYDSARNLTFKAVDVTPEPYRKMFAAMGVKSSAPKVTDVELDNSMLYYFPTVDLPFPEGSYDENNTTKATSYARVSVKYGQATRIVRLDAYSNGKKLDSVYIAATKTANGDSSKADRDLAKRVRQRVEAKLWKPGMSSLEKLQTIASYINKTTHYPNTNASTKEGNPQWWKRWSVEGIDLFYNMVNDPTLNGIMKFQGGITTCVAAEQLNRVATEDLGLRYLYDSDKDEVAAGEGVWIGTGSYSSNPGNPNHESLIYKNANEEKIWIDAQGIGYGASGTNTCAEHGCEEHIVSLT